MHLIQVPVCIQLNLLSIFQPKVSARSWEWDVSGTKDLEQPWPGFWGQRSVINIWYITSIGTLCLCWWCLWFWLFCLCRMWDLLQFLLKSMTTEIINICIQHLLKRITSYKLSTFGISVIELKNYPECRIENKPELIIHLVQKYIYHVCSKTSQKSFWPNGKPSLASTLVHSCICEILIIGDKHILGFFWSTVRVENLQIWIWSITWDRPCC